MNRTPARIDNVSPLRKRGRSDEGKNYQAMECPVCGRFYFSELQEGDNIANLQCSRRGWRYDLAQASDPDLKPGRNTQSVSEYRQWFQAMIAKYPEYDYSDAHRPPKEPHPCSVCGKHNFKDRDSFDVCPVCGWTDDGLMEEEPDHWAGSTNDLCLNDFKNRYLQGLGH